MLLDSRAASSEAQGDQVKLQELSQHMEGSDIQSLMLFLFFNQTSEGTVQE